MKLQLSQNTQTAGPGPRESLARLFGASLGPAEQCAWTFCRCSLICGDWIERHTRRGNSEGISVLIGPDTFLWSIVWSRSSPGEHHRAYHSPCFCFGWLFPVETVVYQRCCSFASHLWQWLNRTRYCRQWRFPLSIRNSPRRHANECDPFAFRGLSAQRRALRWFCLRPHGLACRSVDHRWRTHRPRRDRTAFHAPYGWCTAGAFEARSRRCRNCQSPAVP